METLQPPRGQSPDDRRNARPQDPWADSSAETQVHASEHYQIPQSHSDGLAGHTEAPEDTWKDKHLAEPQDPWAKSATTEASALPPLDIMTPAQEAARLQEIQENFHHDGTEPAQPSTQDEAAEYTPRHLRLNDEKFIPNPVSEIKRREEYGFKITTDLASNVKNRRPEIQQGIDAYLNNTPLPSSDRPAASPDAFTRVDAAAIRERLAQDEAQQAAEQAPGQPEQTAPPEKYKGQHRKLGRIASWFARFRG